MNVFDNIQKVEKDVSQLKKRQKPEPNSKKARIFSELDNLEPNGEALKIPFETDKQKGYIQIIASLYNRERKPEHKVKTEVDSEGKNVYLFM